MERMVALVSGSVQGVGYRAFVRLKALEIGLKGYAENLEDGRVEVVAEGSKDDLEYLLGFIRRGPRHAEVKDVDVLWSAATGLQGFHVY
jgi:acylphosphatase